MYHLENVNENLTSCGGKAKGSNNVHYLIMHVNGLVDLIEVWNEDHWGDDPSSK